MHDTYRIPNVFQLSYILFLKDNSTFLQGILSIFDNSDFMIEEIAPEIWCNIITYIRRGGYYSSIR